MEWWDAGLSYHPEQYCRDLQRQKTVGIGQLDTLFRSSEGSGLEPELKLKSTII